MDTAEPEDVQIGNFWQKTKQLDMYRKESFEKTMPEIAEPIVDYLKSINYDFGPYKPNWN